MSNEVTNPVRYSTIGLHTGESELPMTMAQEIRIYIGNLTMFQGELNLSPANSHPDVDTHRQRIHNALLGLQGLLQRISDGSPITITERLNIESAADHASREASAFIMKVRQP